MTFCRLALPLLCLTWACAKPPEGVFTDADKTEVFSVQKRSDGLFLETRANLATNCAAPRTTSSQELQRIGKLYVTQTLGGTQVALRTSDDWRSAEWLLGLDLGGVDEQVAKRKALVRVTAEEVALETQLARCAADAGP